MKVLNGSPGFPEITPTYWPVSPALPRIIQRQYLADDARGPRTVRYERFVSLTPGTVNIGCRDHFMTIQFSTPADRHGVLVSVHAWLFTNPGDDQLPVRDWS